MLSLLITGGVLSISARQALLPPRALEATKIERVRGNLYIITGSNRIPPDAFSGGNTAVLITATGVLLVDTKRPDWGQQILDRVRTVTDKPVTTIVNTHTHADHCGSNSFFDASVEIVAHENTKTNMKRKGLFKQSNGRGLPTSTFDHRTSIGAGNDRVDLYYFGSGHTNGDAWVIFPMLGVMHAGDMFARKDAPTLDRSNGGSGLEFAPTIGRALATAAAAGVDTVIPGHGPLRSVPELQEYQRFMIDFVALVREAIQAGRSVDEAAASIDLRAKYPGYANEHYRAAVRAIYDELGQ